MSLRFRNLDELGKGSWKINEQSSATLAAAKPGKKKPGGKGIKSTYISKEKQKESGPQERLTQIVRLNFPDYVIEEDKANAIPGKKLEIDIAFTDHKLAVEVDGWQYHGKFKSGFIRDRIKQNLLVCEGWLILRFTYSQIMNEPMACVDMIRKCLSVIQAKNPQFLADDREVAK